MRPPSWHQPQPFPMLSLRYETERDKHNLQVLQNFLGLRNAIVLPKPSQRIAGSKGTVPRSERLARLTPEEQAAIKRTYGPLQQLINDAPDVCQRQPTPS